MGAAAAAADTGEAEKEAAEVDACLKGPEPGQCSDYIERFFFDKRSQECTTFIYRDGRHGGRGT